MKIDPHSVLMPDRDIPEDEGLRNVSRQFESLFVNQLISAMRKTVVRDGLIPESQGEKVYQAMLDQQYAQRMSDTDQIGLSKIIYEQLVSNKR